MAKKLARKAPAKARNRKPGKPTRAKVKPADKRVAADAKAALGALPQWTMAQIEEAFRRFKAANPEPKGELQHINPFTLLVAVVLSAQATDAGVNKATPALFALADTPEKMAALGENRVRDLIKTIGLFRTKAKNVVALSRKLVAEHGGQVPRSREALEALPGVGRKTANVVLNIAFGEPTIAVDTHIFRVGNRTGMATGKTPFEVETETGASSSGAIQASCAPLAYSARALHLCGAQAAVREMHHQRPVPMAGKNGRIRIVSGAVRMEGSGSSKSKLVDQADPKICFRATLAFRSNQLRWQKAGFRVTGNFKRDVAAGNEILARRRRFAREAAE